MKKKTFNFQRSTFNVQRVVFSAIAANAIRFSQPVQFAEAQQRRDVLTVLPTELSAAELEEVYAEVRERAFFSARMANAEQVQKLFDVATRYDRGEINLATARLEMKDWLDVIGYQAEPGKEGTIQDFASDARINLQLSMMSASSAGYGNYIYGQQQPILDQWPAQELFRAAPAKQPRDWITRWQQAGGKLFSGRMAALVNDDIWRRISRFGQPYPPFDYGSHMRLRPINYDDSLSLGVVTKDTPAQTPQTRGFNDDLQMTPDVRTAALRQVLEEDGYKFDGDVLTMGDQK